MSTGGASRGAAKPFCQGNCRALRKGYGDPVMVVCKESTQAVILLLKVAIIGI